MAALTENLQLEKAKSPQFGERLQHFLTLSDPRSVFASTKALDESAELLGNKSKYAKASAKEKQKAKRLYLSAFDTKSGRKQNIIGRMSFQPWGNTFLTASMLIFNKSMVQIAGMQVLNQAFNSTVTAINSTKKSEGSKLLKSFAAATAGATAVGMILKFGLKGPAVEKMQAFIPFAAVAAGQAVNVPLMRMEELEEGVPVMEIKGGDKGKKSCSGKKKAKADVRGYSKAAARKALVEVWATRVFMAIPPMVSVPIIMDAITTKTSLLSANPSLAVPLTSVLVGLNLCLSTPLALSAFPQEGSIAVKKLEASIASKVKDSSRALTYDKGL